MPEPSHAGRAVLAEDGAFVLLEVTAAGALRQVGRTWRWQVALVWVERRSPVCAVASLSARAMVAA